MKKIVVCVSHRTDIKSITIDSDLYLPVHCGADFINSDDDCIQPDNQGENISCKKLAYSELTVQYWAWKNISADYYGLCHYRRYLSFAQRRFHTNNQNQVVEPLLSERAVSRHRLNDVLWIRSIIENCDAVLPESANVRKIPTPGGFKQTVRELWEGHDGVFIHKQDLTILLAVIQQLYPQYVEAAASYLSGTQYTGYNCFIMCRRLFFEMCQFQFDVLFELENRLDLQNYTGNMKRTLGYMGEILFGIYSHSLFLQGTDRIITRQLVYFEETRIPDSLSHGIRITIMAWLVYLMRRISEWILPLGTKRREIVKYIVHWLRK